MENSSKALYIAGSLLISLLVVSLLVFAFNRLGGVQSEKDSIEAEEEITKFNMEFEAYNKNIMYGVDVISCINKAVSNNEKYVKEGKWSSAGASGSEALVQITVNIDKPLKETLQIYGLNSKNKEVKIYPNDEILKKNINNYFGGCSETVGKFFIKNYKDGSVSSGIVNKKMNDTTIKKYREDFVHDYESGIKGKMYLLDEKGSKGKVYTKFEEDLTSLYILTYYAENTEFVKYNDKETDKSWYSIKWTTYLADFKSRKFKCDNIHYDESTGRVDLLEFKEK